jgi:Histidine kinase-, DNA gyrase B-, and HSP90-like ATPase
MPWWATKRKAEANGGNYEPTLAVASKNLGDNVEIRIRDNGTGIPPEVKEKMFNPFFTTKPAGEGTGLGLSISHDIIVKQHGGSIEVETQPGEFTEFRIVLPRASASLMKSGERMCRWSKFVVVVDVRWRVVRRHQRASTCFFRNAVCERCNRIQSFNKTARFFCVFPIDQMHVGKF